MSLIFFIIHLLRVLSLPLFLVRNYPSPPFLLILPLHLHSLLLFRLFLFFSSSSPLSSLLYLSLPPPSILFLPINFLFFAFFSFFSALASSLSYSSPPQLDILPHNCPLLQSSPYHFIPSPSMSSSSYLYANSNNERARLINPILTDVRGWLLAYIETMKTEPF